MLEFIASPEDVIALRIGCSIKGTELDSVMDRLDAIMAAHDKVHVFVETHGIAGLELSSLPHYFSRALPLFGKFRNFGRVAVVADQACANDPACIGRDQCEESSGCWEKAEQ